MSRVQGLGVMCTLYKVLDVKYVYIVQIFSDMLDGSINILWCVSFCVG